MILQEKELKRLEKLMREAGECKVYTDHSDPLRAAVGFFFYGETAKERGHEVCELINKMGDKEK